VTADLRLRLQDNRIRTRFEVEHSRAGAWQIVLVHERRIAWRGGARGSFEIERALPDFPGSDAVTARATGALAALSARWLGGHLPDVSNADIGEQQGDG